MLKYGRYILGFLITLVVLYYVWMSVNPMDPDCGEKKDTLQLVGDAAMPFTLYTKDVDLNTLPYPLIFKPSLCQGEGRCVSKINTPQEAEKYISNIGDKIIIQKIHPGPHEIGLLYERLPIEKTGRIISISQRNYNHQKDQVWGQDLWRNLSGDMYTDRPDLITDKLTLAIDKVIKKIPNMYVSRLDIRYKNEEDIKEGKNFRILEVNGIMGYDLRFWDNNHTWPRMIMLMIRWILVRFLIGFLNVITLNGVNVKDFITSIPDRFRKSERCNDWEKIFEWVHT